MGHTAWGALVHRPHVITHSGAGRVLFHMQGRHTEALHRQERCVQSEFHLQRNQCDGAPAPKVDVRRGGWRQKPKSKAASA